MVKQEEITINGKHFVIVHVAGRYAVYTQGKGRYIITTKSYDEALRVCEEHANDN